MSIEIDKYEDIYDRLKICFNMSFGDGKRPGLIHIRAAEALVRNRREPDRKNGLPGNSLIEIPTNFFDALKETYISRDSSYVSGPIGCVEDSQEQLDGITNMALLMYLSNHLSKEYKFRGQDEKDTTKKAQLDKNKRTTLVWKHIAITDLIASIFVLSKTSKEYEDFFSYGSRTDDNGAPSFVIDLPYIGQLCVHFGSEANKETIVKNAQGIVRTILQEKVKLGQITREELQKITRDLREQGVLPEYEGKLYEYVGAMPIEYAGPKTNECRKLIGNKLPEEITKEDMDKLVKAGLNERELYYFFIKSGAPKNVLNQIPGISSKKITPESIKKSTSDLTISEFRSATKDIKDLALGKEQEKPGQDTKDEK